MIDMLLEFGTPLLIPTLVMKKDNRILECLQNN